MTKRLLICILALSLFSACSGGGDSSSAPPAFDRSLSIGENVDNFFAQALSPSEPGVAVLIVKDGAPVHQQGYGLADIDTGTPIETDSQFHLASVSKQFTALGVLLLFERELLGLDNSIRIYLPELSPSWDTMTIRHLVAHQSGIPDYSNDGIFTTDGVQTLTNRDVIAYFIDQPQLEFEPGSAYRYTNSGYVVLAELIAQVSGMSFKEFMHTHVFDPLGMALTTVDDESHPDLPTMVTGYRIDSAVSTYDLLTAGDSSIVSTIGDLFLYQQALLSGQLISSTSLDIAFADQTTTGSEYGFGWNVRNYRGHPLNEHGGDLLGFTTRFVIVHDLNLTIIALANSPSHRNLILTLRNQIINYYEN